jgi:hypothetical protein
LYPQQWKFNTVCSTGVTLLFNLSFGLGETEVMADGFHTEFSPAQV